MAKKATITAKKEADSEDKKPWILGRQYKILFGFVLILFSVALLLSFISFFIHGQEDQSAISELANRSKTVNNWLGKFGAFLSGLLIYRGFGAASFLFQMASHAKCWSPPRTSWTSFLCVLPVFVFHFHGW